jgi:hypothetical protein
MGTWGNKIKQDDFVMDVIDGFIANLKVTQDLAQTTKHVLKEYASAINDTDDGPLFWLGLAEVQWQFGFLQAHVLAKVKDDFFQERGLERWEEEGAKELEDRKKAIADFISKIETPNPKPKKLPKVTIRAPLYQAGDCLSVSLDNGLFTAAIVLRSDHSNPEYGKSLIGVLDYLSSNEPTPQVFEDRKWLIRTHHNWKNEPDLAWYLPVGHRKVKDRIKVVGKTKIRWRDPKDAAGYTGWISLGEQVVLQRESTGNKTTQP